MTVTVEQPCTGNEAKAAERSGDPDSVGAVGRRIVRLNAASRQRVIEPDTEVTGSVRPAR